MSFFACPQNRFSILTETTVKDEFQLNFFIDNVSTTCPQCIKTISVHIELIRGVMQRRKLRSRQSRKILMKFLKFRKKSKNRKKSKIFKIFFLFKNVKYNVKILDTTYFNLFWTNIVSILPHVHA